MLILIENCFAQEITDNQSKELIEKLEEVLLLHDKGIHYIGAKRFTALSLITKIGDRISERSKSILIKISTQSPDLESLISTTDFYTVIKSEKGLSIKKDFINNKTIWSLNIDNAIKWLSCPAKLYGENLEDGNLFSTIGKHFAYTHLDTLYNFPLQIDHTGGCGEAAKILQQRIIESNAPCMIIIDSDKLTSTHTGSDAIKKCTDILKDNNGILQFHCIEEREIENSASIDIIKKSVNSSDIKGKDLESLLSRIEYLDTIKKSKPEIYKYVDLKQGTCLNTIKRDGKTVETFFKVLPKGESCNKHEDCNFLTPPTCYNILEHIRTFIQSRPPREIKEIYSFYENTWQIIGKKVFSLGICNNIRNT